ncbi:cell adhesion protein [Erysipelotrichaceae bacterium I46]|uniref:Ig-like domain-containing protein n=1 Tax=Clostridium innocuum TaxID=1522 RepID=UPI00080C4A29|nr:Ig-like domain-containing protein [[Clostridium] innocuum]ANU70626.1 cell adhesion protein [Erysipelotrichaceae bacterium I46]ASU20888.1 cell adhesion protein [[Clostridium] innocuum]QQR25501.1 Ig-like domain-containing protein [[Clostridium] innocuum]
MKKLLTIVASMALAVGCMLPQPLHAEESTEATVKTKEQLQEAIKNVNISTIRLGENISADVVIPVNRSITLDLGGKTLTNETSHTIYNKGVLTIDGTAGTVDNVTHAKAALDNDGVAILNSGNFIRSKENGINSTTSGGNSFYTIRNHGDMTINSSVSVSQNGRYSSMIENGWQNGKENKTGTASLMEINGGTFSGGLNTIKNDDYGELTINGGSFSNTVQAALLNWNIATINGGEFTSDGNAILNGKLDDVMDKGQLVIHDGTFKSENSSIAPMNGSFEKFGSVSITGGLFSSDPSLNKGHVAEGYKVFLGQKGYAVIPLATNIELSKKNITLEVGSSEVLVATLSPDESKTETVEWSSSDEKIASVKDGKVTANAPGKVTIIATTEGGLTANCEVTVTKPVAVETPSIDTSKPTDEIKVGVNDEKAEQLLKDVTDQIIAGSSEFTDADTANAVIEAAKAGKTVTVVADVQKADSSNAQVQADAKKIQKELEALTAESNNTATVAMYLDLSVLIKADDIELGNITNLSTPMKFTVVVPENLLAEGREFYILRVHNGAVNKIVPERNKNILTFRTDRFSTYAVVYEDKKVEDNGTTPEPKPEPTPEPTPTPAPEKTIYNVVFVDMNGAVLRTEKVEANKAATAPKAPEVEGYRFVKWDTDFTKVTKDLLVKPVYEKVAATEKPSTPEKPSSDKKSPNTGDTTNAGLFTAFALLGFVSMGIVAIQRKRKQLMK